MTKEEAVVVSCYTGILACSFSHVHEAVEKRLGRPVYTHEFGSRDFMEYLKGLFFEDFKRICFKENELEMAA